MCLANFKPFLQFEDILVTFSCVACVLGLRLSLALRQLIALLARCRAWSREHRNHLEYGQTKCRRGGLVTAKMESNCQTCILMSLSLLV